MVQILMGFGVVALGVITLNYGVDLFWKIKGCINKLKPKY